MKKILMLSALLVALTACSLSRTRTLSCNYTNITNGLTSKVSYSIDHEGDEVKKIRVKYDYTQDNTGAGNGTTGNGVVSGETGTNNTTGDMDGIGTGTDGTTNDTEPDNDGIVDGIVGSAFDSLVNGVASTILDISGLRSRHRMIQDQYANTNGFSVQNTTDVDNNYSVTYVIDFDNMTDNDISGMNFNRDLATLRTTYTNQGFTCSE